MVSMTSHVSPGTRMRQECSARLLALVDADEQVVAKGTVDEMKELRHHIDSGGGWTFLVLTDRRMLFAPWTRSGRDCEQIVLDEVSAWTEATQQHRYAIALSHPPMTRVERVPAHNVLWLHWGNAWAERTRTETVFRFSQANGALAQAMRDELTRRDLPHDQLQLSSPTREERTRGSHSVLVRKR